MEGPKGRKPCLERGRSERIRVTVNGENLTVKLDESTWQFFVTFSKDVAIFSKLLCLFKELAKEDVDFWQCKSWNFCIGLHSLSYAPTVSNCRNLAWFTFSRKLRKIVLLAPATSVAAEMLSTTFHFDYLSKC